MADILHKRDHLPLKTRLTLGLTATAFMAAGCSPNFLTPTGEVQATDTLPASTQTTSPEATQILVEPTFEPVATSTLPVEPTVTNLPPTEAPLNFSYQPAEMQGAGLTAKPILLNTNDPVLQELVAEGYLPLIDQSTGQNVIGGVIDEGLGTEHYSLPVMSSFAGFDLDRQVSKDGLAVYGNPPAWVDANWIGRLTDGNRFVGAFFTPQRTIRYFFADAAGNRWELQGQQRQVIQGAPLSVNPQSLVVEAGGQTFDASRPTERSVQISAENIVGVLPSQIEITSVEDVKQVDDKGNEVGTLQIARDSKGRVMLIKSIDDPKWLVAPFGKGLENGVWRVFEETNPGEWLKLSVKDSYEKMARTSEIQSIAQLIDDELLSPYTEGTIHPHSEVLDYNMQAVFGRENEIFINNFLDVSAKAPNWKQYWTDLGFNGNTGMELFNFLKTHTGGPENKGFWIPSVSPAGTEFLTLRSLGYDVQDLPIKGSGFYLDSLPFVVVPYNELQTNVWARAYYQVLQRENKNADGEQLYFQIGSQDNATSWGLFIHNNKMIFVHGMGIPKHKLQIQSSSMGDIEGNPVDQDPILLTAELMVYLKNMEHIRDRNVYWGTCVTSEGNLCPPQFGIDVTKPFNDVWFQFKP
jgi:hypothetical protein